MFTFRQWHGKSLFMPFLNLRSVEISATSLLGFIGWDLEASQSLCVGSCSVFLPSLASPFESLIVSSCGKAFISRDLQPYSSAFIPCHPSHWELILWLSGKSWAFEEASAKACSQGKEEGRAESFVLPFLLSCWSGPLPPFWGGSKGPICSHTLCSFANGKQQFLD